MNKILIDTMHIYALLTSKDILCVKLSQALDDEKITGVISVTTLTELLILLGKDVYKETLNELLSLNNMEIVETDRTIAIRAGELHMMYRVPLGDSLIAATGIIEGIKHVLTDDEHFDLIDNLIKPINLRTALRMAR
ncbi:type II toxin-antitoxin system VapC family toxin [Candidatus Methanoperedens nitratireducens]|uniref:Putative nucleic acid-binding protein, contains PIN domain n=1 Tax=Candidatus Methanoperedens nitratireducens TaxID=1392998 RepID=A0A284VU56_9EURY|nr:PIN domain-containing protein [Candidatus Methanoperedens nitroreducens]SNQ62697.1 putative nucleic acid-binding protein, contains PIN domain [Candidatus Methanoperedens nitroreducens]